MSVRQPEQPGSGAGPDFSVRRLHYGDAKSCWDIRDRAKLQRSQIGDKKAGQGCGPDSILPIEHERVGAVRRQSLRPAEPLDSAGLRIEAGYAMAFGPEP